MIPQLKFEDILHALQGIFTWGTGVYIIKKLFREALSKLYFD